MERLRFTALASTGVLVGAALTGCNADRNAAPRPPITAHCVDGPQHSSVLDTADRQPLPPLGDAAYNANAAQRTAVGSLAIRDGHVDLTTRLPPAYKSALLAATHDSYVECALTHSVVAVDLTTTSDGVEVAHYGDDDISLTFTDSGNPSARIFLEAGSVRAVLTHESTHAWYATWATAANSTTHPDQEGKALLDELESAYTADMRNVLELYRVQHGTQVVDGLEALKSRFNNDLGLMASIDYTIQHFNEPNGLADLGLATLNQYPKTASNNIQRMVWKASSKLGVKISDFDPITYLIPGFAPLDKAMSNFLETQFPDADESNTLGGLVGSLAGHPYDNPNELLASTIDSDQLNPYGVITFISLMPPARRAAAIRERQIIVELFRHFTPEALPYLQTPAIIQAFTNNRS